MEVGHVSADDGEVDVRRLDRGARLVQCAGGERQELRDVAVVRGHRVRRRVAVETKVGEEGLELVLHRAAVHSSRDVSARSAMAAFRWFFFTVASAGGMIPKVMLVG